MLLGCETDHTKKYERAKSLVQEDTCMKYYNVKKPLNQETDASGVGLGTTLLQVRGNLSCGYDEVLDNAMLHPTAFANRSQSSAEHLGSYIGWRSSTNTALHMKYMSSQTINYW